MASSCRLWPRVLNSLFACGQLPLVPSEAEVTLIKVALTSDASTAARMKGAGPRLGRTAQLPLGCRTPSGGGGLLLFFPQSFLTALPLQSQCQASRGLACALGTCLRCSPALPDCPGWLPPPPPGCAGPRAPECCPCFSRLSSRLTSPGQTRISSPAHPSYMRTFPASLHPLGAELAESPRTGCSAWLALLPPTPSGFWSVPAAAASNLPAAGPWRGQQPRSSRRSGLVAVRRRQRRRERSGPTLWGRAPSPVFTGRPARRTRRSCSVLQVTYACCRSRGEGKAATTASATAGLTRLNCWICHRQAARSPVPPLATCSPAAQRPAVQKEKALGSRDCLKGRWARALVNAHTC